MVKITSIRKPLLAGVLLLLTFLLGFRYPENNWFKYTSHEGHYSIDFPGKPAEAIQNDTSDTHHRLEVHFATYFPNETDGYLVNWIDMSKVYPKGVSMKKLLEDSKDSTLLAVKDAIVTTTATNYETNPYIEFTFKNPDVTGKGRIYIIDKFKYTILTLFSVNSGINANADKFIHSFKHQR